MSTYPFKLGKFWVLPQLVKVGESICVVNTVGVEYSPIFGMCRKLKKKPAAQSNNNKIHKQCTEDTEKGRGEAKSMSVKCRILKMLRETVNSN